MTRSLEELDADRTGPGGDTDPTTDTEHHLGGVAAGVAGVEVLTVPESPGRFTVETLPADTHTPTTTHRRLSSTSGSGVTVSPSGRSSTQPRRGRSRIGSRRPPTPSSSGAATSNHPAGATLPPTRDRAGGRAVARETGKALLGGVTRTLLGTAVAVLKDHALAPRVDDTTVGGGDDRTGSVRTEVLVNVDGIEDLAIDGVSPSLGSLGHRPPPCRSRSDAIPDYTNSTRLRPMPNSPPSRRFGTVTGG